MYLLSLPNPHSAPPSLMFPSTPKLQACFTRFAQDTAYLVNNAFSMAKKPDLAIYFHHSAFCPVPSTFIMEINKEKFSTWPGLTAELIAKHLPKILAAAKGHAKLARKTLGQPVRKIQPQTSQLPLIRPQNRTLGPKLFALPLSKQVTCLRRISPVIFPPFPAGATTIYLCVASMTQTELL